MFKYRWCPRCWKVKHRWHMMWSSTKRLPWCRTCWQRAAQPEFDRLMRKAEAAEREGLDAEEEL